MNDQVLLAASRATSATPKVVDFTTLDGKVLLGYQGWFNCPGEGATGRGWRSWTRDTPSAKTLTVDMYPDLTEFDQSDLYPLPGFTIGGRQAFVYSAMNPNFLWMKKYGLDGVLIWTQVSNARQAGARMLKIAMFDEVNEGTAVFKVAAKRKNAPEQGYWLPLDADGEDLPSDWYLKLSGEITKRFHGKPGSPAFPLAFPT